MTAQGAGEQEKKNKNKTRTNTSNDYYYYLLASYSSFVPPRTIVCRSDGMVAVASGQAHVVERVGRGRMAVRGNGPLGF